MLILWSQYLMALSIKILKICEKSVGESLILPCAERFLVTAILARRGSKFVSSLVAKLLKLTSSAVDSLMRSVRARESSSLLRAVSLAVSFSTLEIHLLP